MKSDNKPMTAAELEEYEKQAIPYAKFSHRIVRALLATVRQRDAEIEELKAEISDLQDKVSEDLDTRGVELPRRWQEGVE